MTKPPAPESILELVNCQCSSLRARRNVPAVIMDWPAPKLVSTWLMKTAMTPTRPVITIQTTTMICQSIIRHDKSRTYFFIQSFKLVYRYIFLSRLKQICFVNSMSFKLSLSKGNYKKHAG